MRLGRGRVVRIAADVEVVVVLAQGGVADQGREAGHFGKGLEGVDDLLDVLGQQVILGAALEVFAVSVDEQHLALALGRLAAALAFALAHHQHAGRDAGAVEQVGGQADHGFQQVGVDHAAADGALFTAPEQHAVGHHGGELAAIAQHSHHVLQEHEVGLLAAQRHFTVGEAFGAELGRPDGLPVAVGIDRAPVDGKRRVGKDAVKAHQLTVFDVLRLGQGVFVAQVGAADAVQQHVHAGNGPHGAVGLLAAQVGAGAVAPMLVDVLLGHDQHAA